MNTLELAKDAISGWNKRIFTENDFFHYIGHRRIIYLESNLIDSSGTYLKVRNRDCIVIHKDCPSQYKPWVQWHELAHQICSHPCENFTINTVRRYDLQANLIASVALIPFNKLIANINDLQEIYNYPNELMECRWWVFKQYGI